MDEKYFREALSDFTYDMASGGAIRHLADSGYTVKQIVEKLDFPTPYERVQRAVLDYFLETGFLLEEEPGTAGQKEKAVFVRDYNAYGKASFRKVVEKEAIPTSQMDWKEKSVRLRAGESFGAFLNRKVEENGVLFSYASLRGNQDKTGLNERQIEYLEGIFPDKKKRYHRLNQRMREMVSCLYQNGNYEGTLYFLKTQEKIMISKRSNRK